MDTYCTTQKNHFSILIVAIIFGLLLTACGGGGGGGGTEATDTPPATVQQGVLIDSAVEGVRFKTATQSGLTDASGTFSYVEGEVVSFFIGDILLGKATGKIILTPIDLVPDSVDEMNPQVTNIIRFLQTLDADNNPSNGIQITTAISNQAAGRTINFNVSISVFENNGNVQTIVSDLTSTLGAPRSLIPSATAQSHLRDTLGGGGSTGEFGSLSITGPSTNVIGTSFNPDFNSRSGDTTTDVLGLGVFAIITWSNNAGNILELNKDTLSVILFGERITISFNSQTVSGSGTSLVIETVDYSHSCGVESVIVSIPECNTISVNLSDKTITFKNTPLELVNVSSGTNINTDPIALNGTLIWQ